MNASLSMFMLAGAVHLVNPRGVTAKGTCRDPELGPKSSFNVRFDHLATTEVLAQLSAMTNWDWELAPGVGRTELSLSSPEQGSASLRGADLVGVIQRGFDAEGLQIEQVGQVCRVSLAGPALLKTSVAIVVAADGSIQVKDNPSLPAAPPRAALAMPSPFRCDEQHIPRSELDWGLASLNVLAMQARYVPAFKDRAMVGIRLFQIDSKSPLIKVGLQNGDVIRKLNGVELNEMGLAMQAVLKLHSVQSIEVVLERKGEVLTRTYAITQ